MDLWVLPKYIHTYYYNIFCIQSTEHWLLYNVDNTSVKIHLFWRWVCIKANGLCAQVRNKHRLLWHHELIYILLLVTIIFEKLIQVPGWVFTGFSNDTNCTYCTQMYMSVCLSMHVHPCWKNDYVSKKYLQISVDLTTLGTIYPKGSMRFSYECSLCAGKYDSNRVYTALLIWLLVKCVQWDCWLFHSVCPGHGCDTLLKCDRNVEVHKCNYLESSVSLFLLSAGKQHRCSSQHIGIKLPKHMTHLMRQHTFCNPFPIKMQHN